MSKLLFDQHEWTLPLIEKTWEVIDNYGKNWLGLDYYEPQIEIISAEQMLTAYSTSALPVMFDHWSFGKTFIKNKEDYRQGKMNLAYEIVINTDPAIAYLLENNSMTMQCLVLCHASVGHSAFFKNNYVFKERTQPDSIIPYLKYARGYIEECEEIHGLQRVEKLIDACHCFKLFGVDKYKRKRNKSKAQLAQQSLDRTAHETASYDPVLDTVRDFNLDLNQFKIKPSSSKIILPEENILYFFEKHSPLLQDWEREIVRIIRTIAQYFQAQMTTKLANEGYATFIHYTLMNKLWDDGRITNGSYLEFIESHSGVLSQPSVGDPRYSGVNPYALGFAIFNDIKRICMSPTDEDKDWFPEIAGKDWKEVTKDVVENYRDESLVCQFLSPKVIRDLRLGVIDDNQDDPCYNVIATHSDDEVLKVRQHLASHYSLDTLLPQLEIVQADAHGQSTLHISHRTTRGRWLDEDVLNQIRDYKYFDMFWPGGTTIYSTDEETSQIYKFTGDKDDEI